MFGYIWIYVDIYWVYIGHILDIFGYSWIYLEIIGYIYCIDIGYSWIHIGYTLNTYPDTYVDSDLDIFGYIWIYVGLPPFIVKLKKINAL